MALTPAAARWVARAIAFALIALLALQIAQPSVFNPVIRARSGAGGLAAAVATRAPERPTLFLRVNIAAHLAILLAALAMSRSRAALRNYRTVTAATLAYGAAVITATYLSVPDLASARVLQAAVIPLTILSLSICLPAIFGLDEYHVLFRGVIVLLTVTAVISLGLVVTGSQSLFGIPLLRVDARGGAFAAVGLFTHRNTIGSFVEFGPALVVYLMTRAAPRVRWIYGTALALIGAHLLLTFSRSAQIVAVISLLPLVRPVRARVRLAVGVAVALLVIACVLVASVPEFREYAALGVSLRRRQDIWLAIIKQALERPWLGFGLRNASYVAYGVRFGPHNLFLAQLAFFGVIGLTLFVVLLVTAGRLIVQRLRVEEDWRPWLIAMLIAGVLLQGGVEYILTAPVFFANSLFWILVGFASRPRGAGAY